MNTKTEKPFCYYNEEQVRESRLLSPERMAEVTAQIDARIEPCFDGAGNKLKEAFIAQCPEGRMLFARVDSDGQREYLRRSVLAGVLTEAELKLVNDRCSSERSAAKDAEAFAKAKKVEAWDDGAFLGDRYFGSMEELCDHLECKGGEWPEYVWAAKSQTVIGGLDVARVVESDLTDRGWEGMDTNDLKGTVELQVALDKFTEANAGVKSYWPDQSIAILLAPWKQA